MPSAGPWNNLNPIRFPDGAEFSAPSSFFSLTFPLMDGICWGKILGIFKEIF